MKETLISVTLAARRFSDCISRVRYQGMSFLLEKNGVPVARIIPVQREFGADFEHLSTALRQARESGPELEKEGRQPPSEDGAGADSDTTLNTHELKRPPLNW